MLSRWKVEDAPETFLTYTKGRETSSSSNIRDRLFLIFTIR